MNTAMLTNTATVSLWCCVCGSCEATVTRRPLNGLPAGVMACAGCVEAVKARQVGVSRLPDGSLSVTDGRVTT